MKGQAHSVSSHSKIPKDSLACHEDCNCCEQKRLIDEEHSLSWEKSE